MSVYGRAREGQRASREAHKQALAHAELALVELVRADTLEGHRALVEDLRALVGRIRAAQHEELGDRR